MLTNPALGSGLQGKTGPGFFAALLPSLVGLGLLIGAIVFFFVLLMGSIQWITSGGDKQALEGARSKLTNGLMGLVILFATFAVIQFIEFFFDINILTLDIGPLVIQ
ncbi:MAG: hypothetical protein AAB535_04295 [Patescibacteria group bacterium]